MLRFKHHSLKTEQAYSYWVRFSFAGMGAMALLAKLLYGTGMRLIEGLRLRVKDVNFNRQVLLVREAKGDKDQLVMLPRSLHEVLKVIDGPGACSVVT